MTIVRSILLVLEVLCSLMLIGLILLQKSKGGGLGTAFGGGGGDSMFGARTGNVLTKATIVLGIIFLFNTLVLGIMFSRRAVGESALDRELMKESAEQQEESSQQEAPPQPDATLPATGGGGAPGTSAQPQMPAEPQTAPSGEDSGS